MLVSVGGSLVYQALAPRTRTLLSMRRGGCRASLAGLDFRKGVENGHVPWPGYQGCVAPLEAAIPCDQTKISFVVGRVARHDWATTVLNFHIFM